MFHRHKLTVVCPNKWPFSCLSILPILSPFPITLVPGLPSLLSIFQHSRHKTCILHRPSFDKTAFHLIRKGIAIVFIISSVIGYNLFIAYKLIMTITRSCFYFDPAIRLLPSLPLSTFPPSLTSAWGHNRRLPPPRRIKKEVLQSVH